MRRRGDDHTVADEQRDRRVADAFGQLGAEGRLVDLAVVVGDQHQLVGEDRRVLVHEVGQLADRRERRRVRRVVVHDDRGVGAAAVQLGVDVHRGSDVPVAGEHGAVGVDGEEIAWRAPRPTTTPTG